MCHCSRLLGLASAAVLTACQNLPERVAIAEPTAAWPTQQPLPQAANGSIFQQATYRPLFEDHRARLIGDTLTIQIAEKVTASQKSTSSVDKSGTVEAAVTAVPLLSASSLAKLNASGSNANSFAGKGATENTNEFTGTITVVVTQVLPNGHLQVAGEKQIGVNSNMDVLRFSGQVDPRAIQYGNTVPSSQVANVRVEQRGRGQQADAQRMGWLSRFFLNVLPI